MSLILVGTNHKFSPIAFRERISFSKRRLKEAIYFLKERGILNAAAILSTCNRVEIYASAEDGNSGAREIENFISRYHEIDRRSLLPYLYIYRDKEALKHLYSVASGIDSLILGETQILGQVKSALRECEEHGFVDRFLGKAFNSAISFAKRMHQTTRISEGKVSAGSVAIDFIKRRIGNLRGKKILIIGVGKVTELALKYLKKESPDITFVSNRTFAKAKILASGIGAKAVRFDELKEYLEIADVVITATASPHFLIKKEMIKKAVSHRLLILDLALPRDVDPGVKGIENVDLFGLENLDTIIKKNMEMKFKEAEKIKRIIEKEKGAIWNELIKSAQEPVLLP